MGIQVTKTSDGWTITKDGKSCTVTDKDKNGVISKADIWNGNIGLTQQEIWESSGLSLGLKEDKTTEEMAKYAQFEDQRKKLQEQEQQRKQNTTQTTIQYTQPKKNFWSKLGNICNTVLPFLPAIGAGLGIMSSWQYNNSAADRAIQMNSLMNIATSSINTAQTYSLMNKMMNNPNFFNTTNNSTSDIFSNTSYPSLNWLETTTPGLIEVDNSKNDENNKKNREAISQLVTQAQADGSGFDSKNTEYIKSLVDFSGEKSYTPEEVAKVQQIQKTPSIPINHIDLEGNDKNKLNPTEAMNIHNLIKAYEDANGDNKFKVMTKENYTKMKEILAKETITSQDIETLKNIWQNPK